MQDGLSDLAAARGLRDEARFHRDKPAGPDSTACRFLSNGRDAYRRASSHFRTCETRLDEILGQCSDPDWSILSASPETCTLTRSEIDSSLETLAGERSAARGE